MTTIVRTGSLSVLIALCAVMCLSAPAMAAAGVYLVPLRLSAAGNPDLFFFFVQQPASGCMKTGVVVNTISTLLLTTLWQVIAGR